MFRRRYSYVVAGGVVFLAGITEADNEPGQARRGLGLGRRQMGFIRSNGGRRSCSMDRKIREMSEGSFGKIE